MSLEFVPHSIKQDEAIFSQSKITLCATGIQWGKTRVGALRTKFAMHQYCAPDDAFIVAAPTYKIMQQSTLPAFLKLMEGLGDFNKAEAVFRMHFGGVCYMRTATDPDSVVGITNVRHVWGDEAGKFPLYFWENLQARAAFKDCPITLTTSPYSLNWIYKEIIKPKRQGLRPDVSVISAASIDNPYFPRAEYERRKETMDPRRFAMMFGGEWNRMDGLVYDCFDEVENIIDPFELPAGTRFYGGIDWGHTEPFVLVVRAITPDGRHYQVSEFYKTQTTITDQILIAKQKKQVFGIQCFYAGPDQPGSIEEFNRNGLVCAGADNDIRRGVDLHYELMKTRKYKIFRGTSPHTIDELDTYHYPEPDDLGPDDDAREQNPVGQFDHALDANRYVTIETYRVGQKQSPVVPGSIKSRETQEDRLKRLMRKKSSHRTENWSS